MSVAKLAGVEGSGDQEVLNATPNGSLQGPDLQLGQSAIRSSDFSGFGLADTLAFFVRSRNIPA